MAPHLLFFFMATWSLGCFGPGILAHGDLQNHTSSMADHKLYIVYTRAAGERDNISAIHLQLLHETLGSAKSAQRSLIYSYKHAMNGFAALLTEDHVKTLAVKKGVVQIVQSQAGELLTTNSWNFLGLSYQDSVTIALQNPTIIGVIDTGVNPSLQSFSDVGMGSLPAGRWNGQCNGGPGFLTSNCNNKLIGVRYYVNGWKSQFGTDPQEPQNAFDREGHGTHVATTAGGAPVELPDLGTARGGNPLARLAVYKIFWAGTYSEADLYQALEDAITDGVDIINLSLGRTSALDGLSYSYLTDPISVGSFNAMMRRNILTVCAAGNSGPEPSTITAVVPWTLTVAATTTNRDFVTVIELDTTPQQHLAGFSIFLQDMPISRYDLVSGESVKAIFAASDDARHCRAQTLDPTKAAGKIVFCEQARGVSNEISISDKCNYLRSINVAGMIMMDDASLSSAPFIWPFFPFSVVSSLVGSTILNYISTSSTPRAKILRTRMLFDGQGAPAVAGFSSRGPNNVTYNILKPDIAAPGVDILAGYGPEAGHPLYTEYGLMSGTSMAAPHVSAVASLIRAGNVAWSPSALKSALMTTASVVEYNTNTPIMIDARTREANPFDYGSGSMRPLNAIQRPGLVYDAGADEYAKLLCHLGYTDTSIKNVLDYPVDCKGRNYPELVSQRNLPSIAIAQLQGSTRVERTVTNVARALPITYYSSIVAPAGVRVTTSPESLTFSTSITTITYAIELVVDPSSTVPRDTPRFGSITWSDGSDHQVRIPIVIHSAFAANANNLSMAVM